LTTEVRATEARATEAGAAAVAPPMPEVAPQPNPTVHLDPALGLVVLDFVNAQGAVVSSIPTERQLDAFRRSQAEYGRAATDPPV
jgi:hypothetical protein